MKLLCEAVSNVTDWHGLGRRLGLTMSQLRGIELTYHMHGLNRLKAEMFDVWLKSSPSASWADLITALQAIRAAYSPTAPGNIPCTVAANKKFPFRFRGTAVQRFAVDKKR